MHMFPVISTFKHPHISIQRRMYPGGRKLPCRPKISPLGTQKVKDYPRIMSHSKVRIEGIKENESCSTTWVHPEIAYEH